MPRIETDFAVLGEVDGDYRVYKRGLDNSADARRWIKNNAEEGSVYQIAAFKGSPIEVEVETIKRRTLFEQAEKNNE